jgi:hypothetical protein
MSPSPPHTGSMSDPAATLALNQTKFHPLLSSHGGVRRQQLVTTLEQATDAHLVLLLAPAGYGKTTLMGQLMERILQKGGYASWLRLDETDNDPARLMCYLYGALACLDGSSFGPRPGAGFPRLRRLDVFVGPGLAPAARPTPCFWMNLKNSPRRLRCALSSY